MGVGLPFAVGAKAAKPNAQVIWRRLLRAERDGARHRGAAQIAALVRDQPQRRLDRRPRTQQARPQPGYTRYDKMVDAVDVVKVMTSVSSRFRLRSQHALTNSGRPSEVGEPSGARRLPNLLAM